MVRLVTSGARSKVQLLRKLDLAAGTRVGRSAWLGAASGLVHTGNEFCVVADDELHLGRFALDAQRPGKLLRLFAGELPHKLKARKKRKPDLEVLMRLPASAAAPHGALLALGSGSSSRRHRGALLLLDEQGRVSGRPRLVDAAPLHELLSRSFADLNLEGGWVAGDSFCLLQRGNKGNSRNAMLRWNLRSILPLLLRERVLRDAEPVEVREFDLGDVRGVPLCFTDASPLPQGGWLFSAVAENTSTAYDDGRCLGSVVGRVDARARLRWTRPIAGQLKVEGIDVQADRAQLRAWLVTDADDPAVAASLLQWEDK